MKALQVAIVLAIGLTLGGMIRPSAAGTFAPTADDIPDGYDYGRAVVSLSVSRQVRIPQDKEDWIRSFRHIHDMYAAAIVRETGLGLILVSGPSRPGDAPRLADEQRIGLIVSVAIDAFSVQEEPAWKYHAKYRSSGVARWLVSHSIAYRLKRAWMPVWAGQTPGPQETGASGGQIRPIALEGNPLIPSLSAVLFPVRPSAAERGQVVVGNNRPGAYIILRLSQDKTHLESGAGGLGTVTGFGETSLVCPHPRPYVSAARPAASR